MERAYFSMKIVALTKEIGTAILSMARAFKNFPMAAPTKEIMSTAVLKESANIPGLMGSFMKDNGWQE